MLVIDYQVKTSDRYVVIVSTTPQGRHKVLFTDKDTGTVYIKGNFFNSAIIRAQKMFDEICQEYFLD